MTQINLIGLSEALLGVTGYAVMKTVDQKHDQKVVWLIWDMTLLQFILGKAYERAEKAKITRLIVSAGHWMNKNSTRKAINSMWNHSKVYMMTSSNGNIFRVTGHLFGEFTGDRWIPHTKASDAEVWSFLWSAPE